jgi:4-amino-4-deoxy-L-arabinose transferase-like glycosyltransferase
MSRPAPRRDPFVAAGVFWLALIAAIIAVRPLTAVDETRYATVAWEMYQSGDLLSLRVNGELYGHKPPLLFWLVNLGWTLFGVSTWWPRLLTGLFGIGALLLLVRLARELDPERPGIGAMALLITASSLYWMAFTGAIMFDLMLAFFVLLGVLGIARASGGRRGAWLLVGAALGLGILTKGPVALLHILPPALLAPWWLATPPCRPHAASMPWSGWYRGAAVALLAGVGIALAWAVPSALAGGGQFAREIFWYQSVDRMVNTEQHLRPFWFFVATAPLLLLPWLFLPAVWRGLISMAKSQRTCLERFALTWAVPVFVGFSLFKGKQIQYLLPVVPAFALLAASGLARVVRIRRWEKLAVAIVFAALGVAIVVLAGQPHLSHLIDAGDRNWVWLSAAVLISGAAVVAAMPSREAVAVVTTIAFASTASMIGLYAGVGRAIFDGYDVTPVSRHLSEAQRQGRPIAHFGKYHGQFQFVGRLQRPLEVITSPDALSAWTRRNPDGAVIVYTRGALTHAAGATPQFAQKFKGRHVYVWRGADLGGVSEHWYRDVIEDDADGS